jgi:hypothetical protein
MVNLTVPGNSILTMPLPDTKAAPERFRGRYNKIKSFLTHYELLLEQNNVLGEKDKCELITRYCSRKVTEFIQALPSYSEKKWEKLKGDLLKYYDADLDNKKYKVNDLVKMVKACKEKKLKNLSAWREYGRKFITVGGWLLKKKKISEEEYATYYWNGIPKALRVKLENRLLARDPTRSLATPFRVDEINEAVEALLQRDRFDMNFAGSDEEDSDGNDSDNEDSDDSDVSDDLRRMRRRIRKKAKYSKRKLASDSDDSDSDEEPAARHKVAREIKRKINGKDEPEIESLIKQLNAMSVDDPGYAALVFRAMKIDPDVMKVIRPPVFVSRPSIPTAPVFPRSSQPFQPQNAPRMVQRFPPPRPFDSGPTEGATCFACGARGHRISMCPALEDLMRRKIIIRNGGGRYVFADGRPIQRLPGEKLVDAIRNNSYDKPKDSLESHLIRVVYPENKEEPTNEVYYGNLDSDTSSSEEYYSENLDYSFEGYSLSEDEGCDEILVSAAVMGSQDNNRTKFAYPVTRSERTALTKRREAMEAEYQSPRARRQNKTKENGAQEIKKGAPPKKERAIAPAVKEPPKNALPLATQMQVPVPIVSSQKSKGEDKIKRNGREEPAQKMRPVDTRVPEYNGRRDDAIMEDVSNQQHVKHKMHEPGEADKSMRPKNESPAGHHVAEKHPRQSEVAAQVKTIGVLNQVLNTRIDLAIGEVLGISKDLSALLGDKIKPKSTKPPGPIVASLPIATSFYTKNRGLLIQLHMQCDGRPITAIIDTGSQLNIVNKSICDSKIIRPVDNKEKISIADANGGQGKLEGMVANVPLNCGEVATSANLYVGTHVPFELLLGRPWQRGNYVTIDERRNGTYLLFKDPKTLEPRYEILVAMDRANPELQYELPVWNVPEAPNEVLSYHVVIDQAPDRNEAVLKGPTTRPASLPIEFPNMDRGSSMNIQAIYPTPSFLNSSISSREGVNHVGYETLTSRIFPVLSGINLMMPVRERPPDFDSPLRSMPTESQLKNTDIQPESNITPLGSQNLLRLDSETLTIALADVPFLKRTNNLHPLILSTADGVLLGNSCDPLGRAHSDFIFLNAGLFNLSSNPHTVTSASAFVRVYTELHSGPPQPWLLPYINNPPLNTMVSSYTDTKSITWKSNETNKNQIEKDTKQTNVPSEQQQSKGPTAGGNAETATGESAPASSKSLAAQQKNYSAPQSHGTQASNATIQSPASIFANAGTDYSSCNKSRQTTTNNTRRLSPILATPPSTPPPTLTTVSSSDEYSPVSSGNNSDADGDSDVEMDSESADMEWEILRKEIREDLLRDCATLRAEQSIAQDEKRGKETKSDEDNKENLGVVYKVEREIYDQLYEAYIQAAGDSPSDETMILLQDAFITLRDYRSAPVKNSVPTTPILSASDPPETSQTNNLLLSVPPVLNTPKYTPIISSPLVMHPPMTVDQASEPTLVFSVQEVSSEDKSTPADDERKALPTDKEEPSGDEGIIIKIKSEVLETSHLPTIAVNGIAPPPSDDIKMEQEEKPSTPPSDKKSDIIATEPSSPAEEDCVKQCNRFSHARRVDRDELLVNLKIEQEMIEEELTKKDCPDRRGVEKYAQRIGETIERINSMADGSVGKIETFKTFVVGLMYLLNLADALTEVPLPAYTPSYIPTSTPAESTGKVLNNVINNPQQNPKQVEQSAMDEEPELIIYNQPRDEIIPQCPSQPTVDTDPRSIPIASRPYFIGGANDFVRRSGGVRSHLLVDIRSLTIVEHGDHVPSAFLRHFTELSGSLSSYIFPGQLAPTHDWPLDVPESKATNFRERIQELRMARREVESIYQNTHRVLTRNQVAECLRPHVTLHKRIKVDSSQLTPIKMDRIYFWQRLHPVWNPLLKPIEAAFIRGAIYMFYGDRQPERAEALERLLRTPHYDDWEVRELVALGALDNEFREAEALAYFEALDNEHWEFHANEEAFRQSANEILADMENEMETDKDTETLVENTAAPDIEEMPVCVRTDCTGFPLAT